MIINTKTLAITIGALGVLSMFPLTTYAIPAQLNPDINYLQEPGDMKYFAQRMKHGKRGNRGQNIEQLIQKLDLTPEQSEQVQAIQTESKSAAEEIKQQMRSQHEEIRSLMASDADPEQIRTQYQEAQQIHQELSNNRFETMLRIREVLTSEQRAKIAELMEQHQGRKFDY